MSLRKNLNGNVSSPLHAPAIGPYACKSPCMCIQGILKWLHRLFDISEGICATVARTVKMNFCNCCKVGGVARFRDITMQLDRLIVFLQTETRNNMFRKYPNNCGSHCIRKLSRPVYTSSLTIAGLFQLLTGRFSIFRTAVVQSPRSVTLDRATIPCLSIMPSRSEDRLPLVA